ncbi:tetratricopeptide repeat protein [Mucisphaera sp.]|uniref:tetratricopeptide repeat protein n=1 Tax=Mucisphaera sp. TaxID=2913024 RepID=UPI003D0DE835
MTRTLPKLSTLRNLSLAALLALTPTLPGCVTSTMLREKGQAAQARGDHEAAIDFYLEGLQKNPADHRARFHLGEAYLATNQPLEAQLQFERVYAARPNDELLTPRVLDRLAEAIYQQDRPLDLFQMLEETAEARGTSRAYLRQADYLVKIGDHDQAAIAYKIAARFAEPGDPTPYLKAAAFYESIGDPANTALNLRYAIYVDPDNPTINPWFRKLGIVPGPTLPLAPPDLTAPTP